MIAPRRILVPTDFSEPSHAAALYAAGLAKAFGAELHVLHAMHHPEAHTWAVERAHMPQLFEQAEADTRQEMGAVTGKIDPSIEPKVAVELGKPEELILEYTKVHDIDLIVMGTHGKGTVEKLLVGSVTTKVMNQASCPVLSIREWLWKTHAA
jgi:nucleotide-binding universal stress UspA family protein